ncbi:plasmid recombination protein [Oscillospiraceae bacterium OttesenSCG-928-G22]|nr:plasmid recombination protein [Oscillospiraceae bacterium OttesenSCG-928-G22]
MKRTISVMVGKGSVNHNSRKFHAENTDPERSSLNRSYCNEDIKTVYHELFDAAVQRYNEKQTRSDRAIKDYYDKIRSGKQEKPFHEVILQIGNRDDMSATAAEGELAAKVLDEYMQGFQERNPNLHVFSAHLHMDEATPHLHIDFVPFTTGSKRGPDTRVSLKQALAAQGFKGGSRKETEWNQWAASEKQQLASIMERHGIEWEQKGTHEKHLSVLDYEKKMRSAEVEQLETQVDTLQTEVKVIEKSADKIQARLHHLEERESLIGLNVDKYDNDPEWQLPEPGPLMSAKTYKTKHIEPFVSKLKTVLRSIVAQYLRLMSKVNDLQTKLSRVLSENETLMDRITVERKENKKLGEVVKDYKLVRTVLGEEQTDSILEQAKAEELSKKRPVRFRNHYER